MKRIIALILSMGLLMTMISCSKPVDAKALSLSYGEEKLPTVLIQYKDANGESLFVENGSEDDLFVVSSDDSLTINEDVDVVYLIVEDMHTKESVREIIVRNKTVDMDLPTGDYIYNFIVDWGSETGKYVKYFSVK